MEVYPGGEASAQEEELMEQWLAEDGQREKELLQLASLYDVERTYRRILSRDPEAAFRKTEQRMQTKRCRLWMQQMIPVAACVASLVVLADTWFFHREEAVEMSPQWVVREANAGMRTHFNLPDGTVVWLNSGSSVTYPEPYEKDHRRVELQGEAYFEVTPDPQKPFIVSVREDRMRIRVLGTAFNVQAYEEEDLIHTTLVSGKVNLEIRDGQGRVLEQVLNPSEKASYDLVGGRMFIARSIRCMRRPGWMES
ncbi:MAG: FecR domain-containing protein [Tannerellaceae bacterium]|nr:FecR domain-containing protein [Tannerellaceae bacterium]